MLDFVGFPIRFYTSTGVPDWTAMSSHTDNENKGDARCNGRNMKLGVWKVFGYWLNTYLYCIYMFLLKNMYWLSSQSSEGGVMRWPIGIDEDLCGYRSKPALNLTKFAILKLIVSNFEPCSHFGTRESSKSLATGLVFPHHQSDQPKLDYWDGSPPSSIGITSVSMDWFAVEAILWSHAGRKYPTQCCLDFIGKARMMVSANKINVNRLEIVKAIQGERIYVSTIVTIPE